MVFVCLQNLLTDANVGNVDGAFKPVSWAGAFMWLLKAASCIAFANAAPLHMKGHTRGQISGLGAGGSILLARLAEKRPEGGISGEETEVSIALEVSE